MSYVDYVCPCGSTTAYGSIDYSFTWCCRCNQPLVPAIVKVTSLMHGGPGPGPDYPVDPDRPAPLLPCLDKSGTLIVVGDKVKSIYIDPSLSGRVEKTDGCTITVRIEWIGSTRIDEDRRYTESGSGRSWEVMR
jgi:hypothetical protein